MSEKQAFLSYCPKCGNQGIYENGNEKCHFCGTKELPTKYDWDKWLFGNSYPEHLDKIIFEEYIKNNPQFDEDLYIQRENKEKLLQKATLNEQMKSNIPKCPTCGSTNIKPISTTKKAIGFATFGVFSNNFGKTMECKNCGYKW